MNTVVFVDVDDTLLGWDQNAHHSICLTSKELNIDIPENVMEVFHRVNEKLWHSYENGEIEKEVIFQRRWKEIFEELNQNVDSAEFEQGFIRNLHYSYIMCDYALEIMEYLSSKYDCYIASNASYSQQIDRLNGCGLMKYFKGVFVSEKAGFAKPKKEFFDYCFKDIDADPTHTYMIGDSLNADISGAHQYGLKTIWINRHGKCRSDDVNYEITNLKQIKNIL